jgi:hypothetical protein
MARISYPLDDMPATSKNLTSFLEQQWQQHTALFLNNPDSHAALLQAVARIVPDVGGKASDLSAALENYHRQYALYYQSLHELAGMIDEAAQAMGLGDVEIQQSFSS